ncbi:PepSY domain-containing protein [Streptomyces lacrimifluminis]|uniref:PepSY domain-containing protein n=1 Tax=Streptomyces lacrimifluminis TaxID=1500077 RepID=A0A917L649_9ACTN|nr:PepSY domain-containing protein [Streptomyces lacrimifluminis]GGJ47071.1 hypothetical protein GCM10012282_50050 [Streptomyces lacrimifluminis]
MKRNIVIATLTATALAGGTVAAFAAGGDETAARDRTGANVRVASDRDDDTDETDAVDEADSADDGTAVRGSTAAEAIAAALRHTPGTAVSAESQDDDDADAGTWGVEVVRGDGAEYDVKVSGTGKVLGAQRDTDDDNDKDDRSEFAALRGAKFDAREAAVAAAAKGTVTEVGGDEEGGSVVWSVETVKGGAASEWKVALDTGKVTQEHSDDD